MKILSVDIGGSFIKYAVMNENSEFLSKDRISTPQEGRAELISALAGLFEESGAQGIAISMPGIIDTAKGYCFMGGALRYNNEFAIRDALYEKCPVNIFIENDAKCAAMAEAAVGALADVADGVVLIFGTMIGGAIIKDHKLHRGKHFSAGEVSYINTLRDSEPGFDAVWGNRCGTPRLCKDFAQAKGLDPKEINGVTVFEAVNSGDGDAIRVLDAYAKEIAVQIFSIQNILDPERFAIGGGISAQESFIKALKNNLEKLYSACPYSVPKAAVVPCRYGNDANLIGALQCWLSAFA